MPTSNAAAMKKKSPFWICLSLLSILLIVVLCIIGDKKGILIAKPGGNPRETVEIFMNALKSGDYETAYDCLDEYSSLGLENEPESEEGKVLLSALKRSYDYSLNGECIQKELNAVQKVNFYRLDVVSVNEAVSHQTEMEYIDALNRTLENEDRYRVMDNLDVVLRFTDGKWKIVPDSTLMNAVQGGRN